MNYTILPNTKTKEKIAINNFVILCVLCGKTIHHEEHEDTQREKGDKILCRTELI